MKLLLVRHGETVDNVAGKLAGITDSCLTCHGSVQAMKLGQHLNRSDNQVVKIFSSDLQRAYFTAKAIYDQQVHKPEPVTSLEILREKDFGIDEGRIISKRKRDPELLSPAGQTDFSRFIAHNAESKTSMLARASTFIDGQLMKTIRETKESHMVVVVSHGIFLRYLWLALIKRFLPENITCSANNEEFSSRGLSSISSWSNTGYLELLISRTSLIDDTDKTLSSGNLCITATDPHHTSDNQNAKALSSRITLLQASKPESLLSEKDRLPLKEHVPQWLSMTLKILSINDQQHLKGLKKTPHGIGSLKQDKAQKSMDQFLKKSNVR